MSTDKYIKNLDLNYEGDKPLFVGKLTQSVIDTIGLTISETDIVLWKDRIKYFEKHKQDFASKEDYEKNISRLPEIIQNPDYVGQHPTKNSIEFIKQIDQLMIVAVRIKSSGNLAIRSCYRLSQAQLDDYINSGTVKKVN